MLNNRIAHRSDAGLWLFHGRRWLNPLRPDDLVLITEKLSVLARIAGPFASRCDAGRALPILAEISSAWAQHSHSSLPSSAADSCLVKSDRRSFPHDTPTTAKPYNCHGQMQCAGLACCNDRIVPSSILAPLAAESPLPLYPTPPRIAAGPAAATAGPPQRPSAFSLVTPGHRRRLPPRKAP